MSTISIISSGGMAAAISSRIAKAGHTVEVISRDPANAQALANKVASGTITGTYGATPAGDIVILAVPYTSAVAVLADFGKALDGKVIVDITNPVAPDLLGLATPTAVPARRRSPRAPQPARMSSRRSIPSLATYLPKMKAWMRSSRRTTQTPRRASRFFSRVSGCVR
ncbi:NAD(P)-binding domain-containing protein [Pseudomonas sp. 10B1]|uniref:NADPH-dependent F420 reductase n=1 Tax=unclassified Pseudomonas TaxID=196821 RepID=UPI002AB4F508|nr:MULTISPECIES: NAD(P)-binding domain-containing protein [unclassified Pseudomonas]MDY7561371.1 NAD(P)-binding domain-containing protein [Pseudomonas sp. AB6]MEA9978487.1 NAD(P)-binding domain-containing protein [Pseudomonas sp. RTS4]MEA9996756.1 NAD(P)-binding domain-containing protein [Pseudomonas sp. AA4]MEB0088891.1 NAD(P)-binding domain-containing protein [Pseudomonas sp. RTI1]MEB0128274.1 NAD(P)-binding domain-containing protein [Pseudomonas sp. CCC1.2]